ncbi:MAG: hypothetical protein TREMPRED_004176 [Tremellales sp. Tagirdzhanova-0007]|nr:MAG: hypothetical protein TREMPRED_004176 [Tremellales sp. Tagirdzhanova-0007]
MPSSPSSSSSSSSQTSSPAQELLGRYELLMTSILGTDIPTVQKAKEEELNHTRPTSKADKQNAKKKRRKARDREVLIMPDDDCVDQIFDSSPNARLSAFH